MRRRSNASTRSSRSRACVSCGKETGTVPSQGLSLGKTRLVVAAATASRLEVLARIPRAALRARLRDATAQHVEREDDGREDPEEPRVDVVVRQRRDQEPEPREDREHELA